jgi:hypothetical protein
MEAWLLLLVALVILLHYLPELGHYLRKGIAEFCQGLRWYQAKCNDQAAYWLLRGLVVALGLVFLGRLAVDVLGWYR